MNIFLVDLTSICFIKEQVRRCSDTKMSLASDKILTDRKMRQFPLHHLVSNAHEGLGALNYDSL